MQVRKIFKINKTGLVGSLVLVLAQSGCASGQLKNIAIGMVAGAAVGAVLGHEVVHHGRYNEYDTRNTVITAVVTSLATGAVLAWHYNSLQERDVEISSRYSRYRLCNPDEMAPNLGEKLGTSGEVSGGVTLQPSQVGKLAISLDDNTKWTFPIFRKRFLPPERDENSVTSTRFIWEILRPGSFVTRSQDPQFFLEIKDK